ncbi:methylosome subunit pICln isoform X1 [Nematostella vectensis]|uniref:methylosome subunit pICln isoform X1 n=1 Tax=Nematostella vectensis TaxID=45351 RepID=UPI002077276E|nr:methylosome subunit pICln isoform X1 [Nematostella vectensis]
MVVMSSFPPPTEGLLHVQADTQAFMQDRCLGNGVLYIAQERLSWSNEQGQGFSLEYPSISVHAICRDTAKFPHQCIYCMLDSPLEGNDDDEEAVGEVRFVPANISALETMFNAMSDGQALHPDPQEEEEEEMAGFGGEEYFTNESEAVLTPEGQATLERLEGAFQMPSQQDFEEMTDPNGHVGNGTKIGDVDMEEEDSPGQFEDA